MTEKVLVGCLGTSAWDSWKESDVRLCSGNDLSAESHMNGTSDNSEKTSPENFLINYVKII